EFMKNLKMETGATPVLRRNGVLLHIRIQAQRDTPGESLLRLVRHRMIPRRLDVAKQTLQPEIAIERTAADEFEGLLDRADGGMCRECAGFEHGVGGLHSGSR